jgi:hypothetical protein
MKVAFLFLISFFKVSISYSQTAFTQAIVTADYSTLKLENTPTLQLSEQLFRFQVATNISERTNFFLTFSKHNLTVNQNRFSSNYPIGVGISYNFNIKQSFCLSFSALLNYSKFSLVKDEPYIKWYHAVFNLGGSTSFLYRLPILHHNLFVHTGVFFSVPLKKEIFQPDNKLQILNTYPFIGLGYRLFNRELE